jgi:prevent-host-death family protein
MTMKGARRTISAAEFKARCLKLLDQVAASGETLIVTKRGKPVAKVVAADEPEHKPLRGSVQILGDIVGPLDDEWETEK